MVFSKLFRNASSAPVLLQMWRSGLFDPKAYGDANEDITLSPMGCLLHYYKYGRFESRSSGQSILVQWLLPKIIDGHLSGVIGRQVADIFSAEMATEKRLAAFGLDIREYTYLQTYERHDFEAAYMQLSDLQMSFAFEQHYLFACKHMRHDHLGKAYKWGISALRSTKAVNLSFCMALQDIARQCNFNLMPEQEMMSAIIKLLVHAELPPFMTFQQALWRLGVCLVDDGSELYLKAAGLLPEAAYMRWHAEGEKRPPHAAGWEAFLNAVSFNTLSPDEISLPVPSPENWKKPFDEAPQPMASGKRLNVRSLPARYWERAEFDHRTCTYLNAFKAATCQAALYCDGLMPTQAGDIHMIDGERVRKIPSFGYHSISTIERKALHFKESALPDFYLFDREGYSGWSSWRGMTPEDLRIKVERVALEDLDKFYQTLKVKFVDGRLSKYEQPDKSTIPADDYIFFALQIPDDTVLSLAWIEVGDAIRTVLSYLKGRKTKLVIKRHPYDVSSHTAKLLQEISSGSSQVIISKSAVSDLIAKAKAVITTNSGVGIEALLQLKRVITLGQSDYAAVSFGASSVAALEEALGAIDGGSQSDAWQVDVKRFLYAYFFEFCFTSERYPTSFQDHIDALFVDSTG